MAWQRTGECCQCGDCCRGNPNPDIWHDAADGMCPLLSLKRKDGTRLCSGHGWHPYYMNGCNVWPSLPEHTAPYPRCTYQWTWVEDADLLP